MDHLNSLREPGREPPGKIQLQTYNAYLVPRLASPLQLSQGSPALCLMEVWCGRKSDGPGHAPWEKGYQAGLPCPGEKFG